jgi:hypothetical protein
MNLIVANQWIVGIFEPSAEHASPDHACQDCKRGPCLAIELVTPRGLHVKQLLEEDGAKELLAAIGDYVKELWPESSRSELGQ